MNSTHETVTGTLFSFLNLYPTLLQPHGLYPRGFSVHGISQARILKYVAICFSRGSSWLRDQAHVFQKGLLFTCGLEIQRALSKSLVCYKFYLSCSQQVKPAIIPIIQTRLKHTEANTPELTQPANGAGIQTQCPTHYVDDQGILWRLMKWIREWSA